ncbi:MAG: polar amino acid transporter, inner rane subunit [Chloroflexi bacterium]|nr:polar amino acid transporter, inner rane subunit [Chloroflexota bacterium]
MIPATDRLSRLPYWLLAALLLAVLAFWTFTTNDNYQVIFSAVRQGVWTTIYVSLIAYVLAMLLGLVWVLMRVSQSRLLQEISSFFVEIVRGIPMLVLLYFISFVGAPALVSGINWIGGPLIERGIVNPINIRQVDFTVRAVLALSIGYSAFISEIFRAGIESIEKEQKEAAQTEGASYWQVMRYILLPQAVRNVLPALGNEFIAMLKDSALVSVLGVQDITQLGKVYSASTFKFFETYSVVAMLYLVMTLGLAMFIRWVEQRLEFK